ncbi:unnamed protein product [Mucor hiemalis]
MNITFFKIERQFAKCSFAESQLFGRTPPFGITNDTNTSPSRHLGDYTHSHETVDKSTYSCHSIGECEVCDPLEKKTQPYCTEFGNKEAVRCEWDDPEARFIKFEGLNVAIAVISVIVFTWRQRKIAREQYQRLAQRIGVTVV